SLSQYYLSSHAHNPYLHSFPTRRSSDLRREEFRLWIVTRACCLGAGEFRFSRCDCNIICRYLCEQLRKEWCPDSCSQRYRQMMRSEEHTSELQSPDHLVCRLLLEKKKKN